MESSGCTTQPIAINPPHDTPLYPPPPTQGHSRPYGSRLCRSPPAPRMLHTAVLDAGITGHQGRLRGAHRLDTTRLQWPEPPRSMAGGNPYGSQRGIKKALRGVRSATDLIPGGPSLPASDWMSPQYQIRSGFTQIMICDNHNTGD